ncbi:hypothetical protein FN846DRAFT_442926 [Sphaerosporella brunnea]|uniref:Uncharacterized protein n=1 Tax=Sphaerosporella brunnea TaxID=1250544 RepID=A0A5J5EFT0_9PEZI|nr:hypothetical protein FN846DRAFT_442926 [Sphaerosporella brunnea]
MTSLLWRGFRGAAREGGGGHSPKARSDGTILSCGSSPHIPRPYRPYVFCILRSPAGGGGGVHQAPAEVAWAPRVGHTLLIFKPYRACICRQAINCHLENLSAGKLLASLPTLPRRAVFGLRQDRTPASSTVPLAWIFFSFSFFFFSLFFLALFGWLEKSCLGGLYVQRGVWCHSKLCHGTCVLPT